MNFIIVYLISITNYLICSYLVISQSYSFYLLIDIYIYLEISFLFLIGKNLDAEGISELLSLSVIPTFNISLYIL